MDVDKTRKRTETKWSSARFREMGKPFPGDSGAPPAVAIFVIKGLSN